MNEWYRLQRMIVQLRDERGWKQFHTLQNLAINIVVEAGELLELFTWRDDAALEAHLRMPEQQQHLRDEAADVLSGVLLFIDSIQDQLRTQPIIAYLRNTQACPNLLNLTDVSSELAQLSPASPRFEASTPPKELAIYCMSTATTLLSLVELHGEMPEQERLAQLNEEIFTLLSILCAFAQGNRFSLAEAFEQKLATTRAKYPVDQAYGRPDKYTTYTPAS